MKFSYKQQIVITLLLSLIQFLIALSMYLLNTEDILWPLFCTTSFLTLAFNIGTGAFCKSTLVRKLNLYDYEGACQEILKWDKYKGRPLKGLTNRRKDENKLCLT